MAVASAGCSLLEIAENILWNRHLWCLQLGPGASLSHLPTWQAYHVPRYIDMTHFPISGARQVKVMGFWLGQETEMVIYVASWMLMLTMSPRLLGALIVCLSLPVSFLFGSRGEQPLPDFVQRVVVGCEADNEPPAIEPGCDAAIRWPVARIWTAGESSEKLGRWEANGRPNQ